MDIKIELGRKKGDKIIIYACIRILSDGKMYIYIGSTKRFPYRKKQHKNSSKKFIKNKDVDTGCVFVITCEGKLLKEGKSLKEYYFEELHTFEFSTQENASKIEQAYIDMYNDDPNYKVMNLVRANFNSSNDKDIQKHYTRLIAGLHYEHDLEIGHDEIDSLFTELGYCDLNNVNDGISATLKNYLGLMAEHEIGEGIKSCGDETHFNCICGRPLPRNVYVYTNILTGKPCIFGGKCVLKAISPPPKTRTIMDTLKAVVNSMEIQKNIIKNKKNTNKQSKSGDYADTNPKNPNSQTKTNSTTNEDYITRPEQNKTMMVYHGGYQLAIDLTRAKLNEHDDITEEECDEIKMLFKHMKNDIKWLNNYETEKTQKNIVLQIDEINNTITERKESKKKAEMEKILKIGKKKFDEWRIDNNNNFVLNDIITKIKKSKQVSKNEYELTLSINASIEGINASIEGNIIIKKGKDPDNVFLDYIIEKERKEHEEHETVAENMVERKGDRLEDLNYQSVLKASKHTV